jgi:prepilin-type N-terminal cleavage/methylation domain-containing protein
MLGFCDFIWIERTFIRIQVNVQYNNRCHLTEMPRQFLSNWHNPPLAPESTHFPIRFLITSNAENPCFRGLRGLGREPNCGICNRATLNSERRGAKQLSSFPLAPAFSLFELLVVIAILAILAVLIAPAVNNFGKANSLTNAGNRVAGLVAQAQQNASSRNVYTALVLINDRGAGDQDRRAFSLWELKPGAAAWTQVNKWEILPTGTVVDDQDCSFLTNGLTTLPGPATAPQFRNQVLTFAARVFLPRGGLLNPDKTAKIRLVEGIPNGATTTYTRLGSDGKPANVYHVTIIGNTGLAKEDRE